MNVLIGKQVKLNNEYFGEHTPPLYGEIIAPFPDKLVVHCPKMSKVVNFLRNSSLDDGFVYRGMGAYRHLSFRLEE